MLRRAGRRRRWPLALVGRAILPLVPVVAVLGLLASIVEGAGVGLLIPLLSLLLAENPATGIPAPLRALASLFSDHNAQTRAIMLGTAIFTLVLIKGIVQAANECLLAWIQARLSRDLRDGVADSLLRVDYSFFSSHDVARLTRIASNDSWAVIQASQSALGLIPAVAGLLVFGALLALLSLKLFLIVLVGGAAVQGLIRLFERALRRLSYEQIEAYRLFWQRMLTVLQAPRVIRLFGQQRRERDKANSANERLRRLMQSGNYLNAFVHPSVDALVALLFLAVLFTGYWLGMSIPAITAFLLLMTRAQPHAKSVARARLGIASFEGSVRDVEWLLSQRGPSRHQEDEECAPPLDRTISFERVSFTYPNGTPALQDVSVTIEPGMATALIGQSGSGKTTMVNLLCRLLEPQSGNIRIGTDAIAQFDRDSWRRHIAVAGQDSELVSGTLAENIGYGRPEATAAEIAAVTRAAGADGFIMALPEGYNTVVGPQGLTLSGGQRQRIGVARALLLNPDLLILDEAFSAVDALSNVEIVKLAKEHRYFRTLLIISHRKTTIAACERGIVLHGGRIVEEGPLSSLDYFRNMAGHSDE